ncbi:fatty acid desaturase [Planctomycetota bacterium]|nr:fatty acid desaturase [Planctomycetota bacterium]
MLVRRWDLRNDRRVLAAQSLQILPRLPPSAVTAATGREPRCGAELVRAAAPFEREDRFTSWCLLIETLLVLSGLLALALLASWWPVQILAGLLAGLVQVRLFIFYHDTLHGALFRGAPVVQGFMTLVGVYFCTVRSVWSESHDFHHQHNGKLAWSSVGSYPLLSTVAASRLRPGQDRLYRLARHPLTMLCGYLTTSMIGLALVPFLRAPRKHAMAPVAVALHLGLIGVVAWLAGPFTALCAVVLPNLVSTAIGAYLFYAQHNFPDLAVCPKGTWSYTDAAVHGSSLFEMSPMMHWFTGNIGFHHVHHLSHRIPFYRLREAMRAIPELHHPGRTSWAIADIRACLRLHVWDDERGRLVALGPVPVPVADRS